MSGLKGLATGIGSLPHKDAERALDLIFKYLPQVPFWPQLPKRDIREGMIIQFSENLPCLKLIDNGLVFSADRRDRELEIFYEKVLSRDLEYFKISRGFSQGVYALEERLNEQVNLLAEIKFIKCQITGPFTFAAGINDDKGIALLHDDILMQAIIKGLTLKALWQIDFFREFGKKIIVFADEPSLSSFGSAYTALNKEEVVRGLTELAEGIKSEDVLLGVHCCGNTDWSILTETPNIDIISFDAFSFLDKFILYADNLKAFVARGGIICWGIAPTQEPGAGETAVFLKEKIYSAINILSKKGVDRGRLEQGLFLSPACGLGTLDSEKSEAIFRLLAETASLT